MTVTKQGRVISNPQLSKTHPTYVGRVTWVGNISKSYLAYKLVNLTFFDSNTYGCQIDVGGFRRTIHSKITLHVQVRFWWQTWRVLASMYDWTLPVKPLRRNHIYTTSHLPQGMTPHFYVESWDQVAKLFWNTLLVAAVFRAILLQFRVKFTFFFLWLFMFVF